MQQFFMDEESPCGAVKTGHSSQDDGVVTKIWECGCKTKQFPHGIKTTWCGWMAGKVFRILPGIFEPFASQDDTRIAGTHNGKKLYQR